eukprot:gene1321-767_t
MKVLDREVRVSVAGIPQGPLSLVVPFQFILGIFHFTSPLPPKEQQQQQQQQLKRERETETETEKTSSRGLCRRACLPVEQSRLCRPSFASAQQVHRVVVFFLLLIYIYIMFFLSAARISRALRITTQWRESLEGLDHSTTEQNNNNKKKGGGLSIKKNENQNVNVKELNKRETTHIHYINIDI